MTWVRKYAIDRNGWSDQQDMRDEMAAIGALFEVAAREAPPPPPPPRPSPDEKSWEVWTAYQRTECQVRSITVGGARLTFSWTWLPSATF